MSKDEILNALSRSAVFNGLTHDDLMLFCDHCQKANFEESDTLIKEGEDVSAFHVITKGQLKVFLPQRIEGRREERISDVKLNVLQEGDYFGEYGIIGQTPASASIMATEPGELIKIPKDDFNRILTANDRIARIVYHNMLRILIKRLRKREKEYDLILLVG